MLGLAAETDARHMLDLEDHVEVHLFAECGHEYSSVEPLTAGLVQVAAQKLTRGEEVTVPMLDAVREHNRKEGRGLLSADIWFEHNGQRLELAATPDTPFEARAAITGLLGNGDFELISEEGEVICRDDWAAGKVVVRPLAPPVMPAFAAWPAMPLLVAPPVAF
jgi:hypothetical protein